MDSQTLKEIGLTENEVKIYLVLLEQGSCTAYDLGKRTGIYRVHIYDKVEQLIKKGLATHIYKGSKKYFQATHPEKIKQYLEEKKKQIENQEEKIDELLPDLVKLMAEQRQDTRVEVFQGNEGLKYCLKNMISALKSVKQREICITGIDDAKYHENLPVFMQQYFRDIIRYKIHERVITLQKNSIFSFAKETAPTTEYRFLRESEFNPANTFVYADEIVIVSWGAPVTAIRIQNKALAGTYRNHFEQLWSVARTK
ncbi:MAG: helix-turn-helix domain-containing protein [Candidatus Woesearchaeota archaeon]|nr:helix-turn-helix domain-containing protein [Candidatus Woesearchaeota archaeon]